MIEAHGNVHSVIRFHDGEEIVPRMSELATSAVIAGGIGMLRDVQLGYWSGAEYETRHIQEPVELLTMQGTIGRGPAGSIVHCHVSVAGRDGSVVGGHLLAARVANTVELVLIRPPGIAIERRAEETGLMGLHPRTIT